MFRRPVEGKITVNVNDGNPGEIGNWKLVRVSARFELARVRVIIDLRRLSRMFWQSKIDNEQSSVLVGGGGGDAAYETGDRDRETV